MAVRTHQTPLQGINTDCYYQLPVINTIAQPLAIGWHSNQKC